MYTTAKRLKRKRMKKRRWKKEREREARDVYRGLDTMFVFAPACIVRKHCIEGGIKKRKRKGWKKEQKIRKRRRSKRRWPRLGHQILLLLPVLWEKYCIEGGVKKRKGWKERRSKKLERKGGGGARDVDRGLVTRGQTTASSAFLSTFRPHYVYITTHVDTEYTLRILLNTIQLSSILVDIPCLRPVAWILLLPLAFPYARAWCWPD